MKGYTELKTGNTLIKLFVKLLLIPLSIVIILVPRFKISVYDDKIMVWNEGSLPEGLTIEDLKRKHSSRPYNPMLAGVFFKRWIN